VSDEKLWYESLTSRHLKILSSEVFPTATVSLIHKTSSQTAVQNYRPIALLPTISKVFEKRLHKHVYSYLE